MNIHQMGEKLFNVLAGGVGYRYRIQRGGGTLKTNVIMRVTPAEGLITDGGELRLLEHDRVGFIGVEQYAPEEPQIGDTFVAVDDSGVFIPGKPFWIIVPTLSETAWDWHGTDEKNYMVNLKQQGIA